jgi:hypothetical protein
MPKVTVSFVMPVRPSAFRMNNSSPGSSEISYLSIFLKSDKIQVSLIFDRNNSTLHENQYTFMIISPLMPLRNVSDKIKTHILCSIAFFPENCALSKIMWKNMVQPERSQVTI